MTPRILRGVMCAALAIPALVTTVAAQGALTRQYAAMMKKAPPTAEQTGVDVYPGAVLRVDEAAQLMAANYEQNPLGQPPAVYALTYFVTDGNYQDIARFYGKYVCPGMKVVETGQGTHSLRTEIPLAPTGTPRQRIIVAPSFTGVGCTTAPNEDYGAKCVTIYVVTRGPAGWAANGRPQR